jgi:hypothetical protein
VHRSDFLDQFISSKYLIAVEGFRGVQNRAKEKSQVLSITGRVSFGKTVFDERDLLSLSRQCALLQHRKPEVRNLHT